MWTLSLRTRTVFMSMVLLSMCLWSNTIHAVLTKSCELIVEYSLRVVSKDPQVSRQNQWCLFQVTCRPNIPRGCKRELDSEVQDDPSTSAKAMRVNTAPVDTRKRQRKVSKANSQHWNKIDTQSQMWVTKTYPNEPSFVCMYWKVTRGRQQVIWQGPGHMKSFAEDPAVLETFKEVALERSCYPAVEHSTVSNTNLFMKKPIVLHSQHSKDYRSDQLYKLIPSIVNPAGKRNFYGDLSNRPTWYPSVIPFESPNHPKPGDTKMTADEMRSILDSFIANCSNQYSIRMEDDDEESGTESDVGEEHPLSPEVELQQTPGDMLQRLSTCQDWQSFTNILATMRNTVDLNCVKQVTCRKLSDIPTQFIDNRRQEHAKDKIPSGFQALHATGDGNCLFNSASILLFGSEGYSVHLRLSTVIHAVDHFDHYLKMLKQEITQTDVAQAFLSCVASNNTVVTNRPTSDPTAEELILYSMRSEIQLTALNSQYSGFLQVLFLAGACRTQIQQHCYENHELYQLLLPPCSCCNMYRGCLHIMWAAPFDPQSLGFPSQLNHIFPLVKVMDQQGRSVQDVDLQTSTLASIAQCKEITDGICMMNAWNQCLLANHLLKERVVTWVSCDRCHSWYHCPCIGVCKEYFDRTKQPFVCCTSTIDDEIRWPQLNISYLSTLYLGRGISDAVIDFYIRSIVTPTPIILILGTLTYEAIKKGSVDLKTSHRTVNADVTIDKPIVLFPCKPENEWHWILVMAVPSISKAYVLDSASVYLTTSHKEVVSGINAYLTAVLNSSVNLEAEVMQVTQQTNGIDCGLHVLRNISVCAKLTKDDIVDGHVSASEFVSSLMSIANTTHIRQHILLQCYKDSLKFELKTPDKQQLPLRRSKRKAVGTEKEFELKFIQSRIENEDEDGLQVQITKKKGRGVFTTRPFRKGECVCEYVGDLLSVEAAKEREDKYKEDPLIGSYTFYFEFQGKKMCIDATEETGRLFNHSKRSPNAAPRVMEINKWPHVYFVAIVNIQENEEILYDYGERRQTTIADHPWLVQ